MPGLNQGSLLNLLGRYVRRDSLEGDADEVIELRVPRHIVRELHRATKKHIVASAAKKLTPNLSLESVVRTTFGTHVTVEPLRYSTPSIRDLLHPARRITKTLLEDVRYVLTGHLKNIAVHRGDFDASDILVDVQVDHSGSSISANLSLIPHPSRSYSQLELARIEHAILDVLNEE
jgi:hypothetical protein